MDISIVIPLYNEEENVELLHEFVSKALRESGRRWELIMVDDGSSDATLAILKKIAAEERNLKVISFRRNFGQTAAMAAGFDLAEGAVVIPMDGDLQNDPEDIPKLLEKVEEGFDVVSGWRKNRKDRFINRKLPSIIANWLISRITGVYLHDYGCTLKAYRKEVLENINLYGEMHRFIPALASLNGARVTEIPVNHREREYGTSKYGISRTFKVILDLVTVKFLLSYSTKPIQIFGGLGISSLMLGFLSFVEISVSKFVYGADVTGNPFFLLFILFILIGIQFISMGLLGEINIRTYFESQGKPIYVIKEIVGGEEKS
ncbi:MAG: glycosyltransferase family 2 protein [bacterium]|nr:glycosyltransferase family 2 protein [bacterium]